MASPVADSYTAFSGTLLRAGILAPGLSGGITLAAMVAAGVFGSNAAAMAGNLAMADAAPGGAFSGLVRPSWLQSPAVLEWVAVPNSTLSGSPGVESALNSGYGTMSARVNAENGTALDRRSNRLWLGGTGGHSDWAGNGISSIDLGVDNPVWVLRRDRTIQGNGTSTGIPVGQSPDQPYYFDGRPASRHTYQGIHYIEKLNKYLIVGGFPWQSANGNLMEPSTFDETAGDWDAAGTWNKTFSEAIGATNGIFAKHPVTEDIYFGVGGIAQFFKLDTTTKVWSLVRTGPFTQFASFETGAISASRNGLYVITNRAGTGATFLSALYDLTNGTITPITINASAALTAFQAQGSNTNHAGIDYNEHQDCFYYYFGGTGFGGRVFKIQANGTTTWDMTELTMTGVTVPAGTGVANGNTLSRFRYVPGMRAVFAFPAFTSPIYMAKTE